MPVIHETDAYSFATHRGGGASITRKSDNTSVFLHPGDSANAAIFVVTECYAKLDSGFFNSWCDEFSDYFDAHAHHNATN